MAKPSTATPTPRREDAFEIIVEAIEALGGDASDVLRTRMYLTAAEDWEAVGRAHGECFRGTDPAATMVVVKELLDPRWRVEIEAEAKVSPKSSASGVNRPRGRVTWKELGCGLARSLADPLQELADPLR